MANAAGGNTRIAFDPALCAGTTIALQSALPPVAAGRVFILGCAAGVEPRLVPAPAFAAGSGLTLNASDGYVCGLRLEGFPGSGLLVMGGARNLLQGNVVRGNRAAGIRIANQGVSDDNIILGNEVGVFAGALAGNCTGGGACGGIEVGTLLAGTADRTSVKSNVVADTRASGIVVRGGRGHVLGENLVGTDATGSLDQGNDERGVLVQSAFDVVIRGNRVAANGRAGVRVEQSLRTLIAGNVVGSDASAAPLGNGSAGIAIDGGSFAIGSASPLDRNVVAQNVGHGIHIEAAQAGQIAGNFVGTDASGLVGLGDGGVGILVEAANPITVGGASIAEANVVGAHALGNIVVAGAAHVVRGNDVGIGADGATPLLASAPACAGLSGAGIAALDAATIQGNLVAANACDGILVAAAGAVDVRGNVVGLGGRGNGGDGIRVLSGAGHVIGSLALPNVVAWNGGDGIHLGPATTPTSAVVGGNEVRANAGGGIVLEDADVAGCRVSDNAVSENGGKGIELRDATDGDTLARNTVWDNGSCAIRLAPGVNGDIAPPTVTSWSGGLVTGTVVEPVAAGGAPQATRAHAGRIELFVGAGPTAPALVYLTAIDVPAGTAAWSQALPGPLPPAATIVATFTDAVTLATSAHSESCGGADEDCDGVTDEPFDFDGDGSTTCGGDCDDGDATREVLDADQDGSTTCDGDCDDGDPALEALDLDQDGASTCDGDCWDCVAGQNLRDDDGDGFSTCDGDCDDGDAAKNLTDADGDHVTSCSYVPDCDDNDAMDMVDDDLDGVVPCHGECDPTAPDDADGDGYTTCDGDCNDQNRALNPSDADGDGYSTCSLRFDCDDDPATQKADPDGDGTVCLFDCDESDSSKNCSDADRDGHTTCAGCAKASTWGCGNDPCTVDGDGDGLVTCVESCFHFGEGCEACQVAPGSTVTCPVACLELAPGVDRDDQLVSDWRGVEVQNMLDDDHDGFTDELSDGDGDGAPSCAVMGPGCDCDDADARARPGLPELCDDGVDNDCDPATADAPVDQDHDHWSTCAGAGSPIDPDDGDANVPVDGACADVDRDGASPCDAAPDCAEGDPSLNLLDFDGDGVTSCGGDCDDSDAAATSVCAARRAPQTFYVDVIHVPATDVVTFSPKWTFIHPGDTVEWRFPAPAPDTVATDSIIPVDRVGDGPELCHAYRPVDPAGVVGDDFTGPLSHLPSGIFSLGPDGAGFDEEDVDPNAHTTGVCPYALAIEQAGTRHLCRGGADYASMESTWADPQLNGVFIRLRWDDVNPAAGVYDWSDLDREMDQAVAHGKLFSLAYKAGIATPAWIFDAALGLGDCNQVQPLYFNDRYDEESACQAMTLGSPLDPSYECHYFELLRATAEHIRSRNAWYRALAYVKLSGANTVTQEARLPRTCDCDACPVCNTEVWAKATLADGTPMPYTPRGLYAFFERQEALLKDLFPDKELSYQLINNGFPQVDGDRYLSCIAADDAAQPCTSNGVQQGVAACGATCPGSCPPAEGAVPGPNEQTEVVLTLGRTDAGGAPAADAWRFAVQHNGLRPITAHDPNAWAVEQGCFGQPTGYQTGNSNEKVANPHDLDLALQSELDQSSGMFFETYEQRLWEVRALRADEVVDPAGSNLSLGQWGSLFAERRRDQNALDPWSWGVADPYPATHDHTFPATPRSGPAYLTYVHGSGCAHSDPPEVGVIAILP
ncbi:MAG: right-handed parallel beta-helix repeat-containing protein [Myxococcota bacterium]